MSMDEYNKLAPGMYLQIGSQITSLKSTRGPGYPVTWDEFVRGVSGTSGVANVETIAAQVAWVWIAMSKRRQQLLEIPYKWEQGGKEFDGDEPFDLKSSEILQQTDGGLQLYATAYWLKQKNNGQIIGVRWMDPSTIEPDYETATVKDGITQYILSKEGGEPEFIPAADIIRFMIPGMRELRPGTAAACATGLAASILRGIDQTDSTFYANNGLPIMLVKVPAATAKPERNKLETAFRRLFNRGGGTRDIRVQAVGADVTVEPLSFKPADMDKQPLEESKIDAILAAHDVPKSIALSNAATYATDIGSARRFVMSMGQRLEYIAGVINADPDFMAAGFTMVVRVEDHTAMKEDEAQRSKALADYVASGFTLEAAAYLVGINFDDFPDDIEVFDEPEPVPEALAPFAGQDNAPAEDEDDRDMEAVEAEEKSYRRWLKKRDNPDPDKFDALHLTDDEKLDILWHVKGYEVTTETDELLATLADTMVKFDAAMAGGKERIESENED